MESLALRHVSSTRRTILRLGTGLGAACAGSTGGRVAWADSEGWAALRGPGTHALMRHEQAPGTGDPAGFVLEECATQRNLDAQGRVRAIATGARFRAEGIAITHVLSSRWCRALETARLMGLGTVVPEPSLDSFFEERGQAQARTLALRLLLLALPREAKAVLVTHQVNVTALTGVYPASGEITAITQDPATGAVTVAGRIRG